MSYALIIPTQVPVVGSYKPRSPSPLSGHHIAEERGMETPHVFIIEALPVRLPVVLRKQIVPQPDPLYQKLSEQEKFPREEDQRGVVTWDKILETIRLFLKHLVNSQFSQMNDTYARHAAQLVFASGQGGALIPRPAPHRAWGCVY
jgi:hypothetical protein